MVGFGLVGYGEDKFEIMRSKAWSGRVWYGGVRWGMVGSGLVW